MLAAIDWSLTVQVTATVIAAAAAVASWFASTASRDALREQRQAQLNERLQALHETLSGLGAVVGGERQYVPRLDEYEPGRRDLGRHLAALPMHITGAEVVFRSKPPAIVTNEGLLIERSAVGDLDMQIIAALTEVEELIKRNK